MIAMPVTGYVNSVIGGHPTSWFGLFEWPALVARNDALAHAAGFVHYGLAWALGAVLALHFAAVAWHVWVKRDDVFARMWPAAPAALTVNWRSTAAWFRRPAPPW